MEQKPEERTQSHLEAGSIIFEEFTAFALGCFKIGGLGLIPEKFSTRQQKILSKARKMNFWMTMLSDCLIIMSLVTLVIINIDNLEMVSSVLPDVMNTPFIAFKILMTFLHKDQIFEVLSILKEIFPKTKVKQNAINLESYLRPFKLFSKCYISFMIFIQASMLVLIVNSYVMNGTDQLAIKMWLPFSYSDDKVFIALHVWIYWLSFNIIVLVYGVDLLFFTILTMVSMNFDILKVEAETIGAQDTSADETMKMIRDLAMRHERVISLCDQLEGIFSSTLLYNFAQSAILICFVAFQLSSLRDIFLILWYVPYLAAVCNQIFFVCYLGQMLKSSSSDVAIGVYNCAWFELPNIKLKNAVWMMLLRSQTPKHLTAKGFRVISLEAFASVTFYFRHYKICNCLYFYRLSRLHFRISH